MINNLKFKLIKLLILDSSFVLCQWKVNYDGLPTQVRNVLAANKKMFMVALKSEGCK